MRFGYGRKVLLVGLGVIAVSDSVSNSARIYFVSDQVIDFGANQLLELALSGTPPDLQVRYRYSVPPLADGDRGVSLETLKNMDSQTAQFSVELDGPGVKFMGGMSMQGDDEPAEAIDRYTVIGKEPRTVFVVVSDLNDRELWRAAVVVP